MGELTAACTVHVRFTDVDEGAYYVSDVYWALERGITTGTSARDFSPGQTCTRAQAMTFLWRYNGSPVVGGSNPFTDVSPGDYFYNAVLWAYQNKITSGTTATTFSPNKTCTRAEIITMIWRCRRQWPGGAPSFKDIPSPSYYYYPVAWATERGITSGTSATSFSPGDGCTRAQIVRFLHNCEGGGYARLDPSAWELYYPYAEAVLNEVGWDLKAAFNWSASKIPYYGHGKADMPETGDPGSEWFANFGFTKGKGNCFVMAATFWEMAVLLGYAPRQIYGKVLPRSPHSWVEIDFDGKTYVFDPDYTYSKKRNGYMITYGQSDTWAYSTGSANKVMSR